MCKYQPAARDAPLQGCSVTLADCEISSATGVGVGIEGGAPRLLRCSVHNCQRHGRPARRACARQRHVASTRVHLASCSSSPQLPENPSACPLLAGVAVFGDLLGGGCAAQLEDCTLVGNRLNGLLVRDGAQPVVRRCTLSGNGEVRSPCSLPPAGALGQP